MLRDAHMDEAECGGIPNRFDLLQVVNPCTLRGTVLKCGGLPGWASLSACQTPSGDVRGGNSTEGDVSGACCISQLRLGSLPVCGTLTASTTAKSVKTLLWTARMGGKRMGKRQWAKGDGATTAATL